MAVVQKRKKKVFISHTFFFHKGNYFSSHFIMGGERFDTPQPEAYLFGENADLNFLGSKPTPVCFVFLIIFKSLFDKILFVLVSLSTSSSKWTHKNP